MLLRDNTSQYLYILLSSSVIKIELKKCVVHKIGRMRLHLRPQEPQTKWIVCFILHQRDRIGEGKSYSWGVGRGRIGQFSGQEFFSAPCCVRIYLNRSIYFLFLWFFPIQREVIWGYLLRSEKQWYETHWKCCFTCTMCSRNSINFAFWCTKMWMNSSARAL